MSRLRLAGIAAALVLLAACVGGPPAPTWQIDAKSSLDAAVAAYLEGNTRLAESEFARARQQLARTGRADLVARAELTRCAARTASLVFETCTGFEALRADAPAAERAYADYLAGRLNRPDAALLPEAHRAVASGSGDPGTAAGEIADPRSRLVAAGVLFETGRADGRVMGIAIDTASEQGWRRPLLAWLRVQLARAESAGASQEAEKLRRRIALVEGETSAPAKLP